MARPDSHAQKARDGAVGRYLLDGERVLTAVHQHWAKVAEPVASVTVALVLVLAFDSVVPASLGTVADLLWWAWFVLVGRAIWKVIERQHDWFVATDKRLILTHGLITRRVAMMPLTKVTDMSYNRSAMGRLLGYGTFVMESAGQDQALHRVRWVADPDRTYRAICAEIFVVDDHARVMGEPEHDDRFGEGPGTSNAGPTNGPDTTNYSRAIYIRPASQDPGLGDPAEPKPVAFNTGGGNPSGSDLRGSDPAEPVTGAPDIHEADTGPIPRVDPTAGHDDS
jgi:hypothetical protein